MAIQIIGNVGNVGHALPMVSAYPTDINDQYVLAWDPVQQALNYVPFIVDTLGSVSILKDLAVGEDLAVVGGATVGAGLAVTGATTSTAAITAGVGAQAAALVPGLVPILSLAGTQVVALRKQGWVEMTGATSRATKDVATVTLPELAALFHALQVDLIAHGLIGT